MAPDIVRDSTLGQIINWLSDGKLLPYPEQRPNFVVPARFYPGYAERLAAERERSGGAKTPDDSLENDKGIAMKRLDGVQEQTEDPNIVGWYGDDDPDNPRNWSFMKRASIAQAIGFMTFSMYIASAIYVPSVPGIIAEFGVTLPYAMLGLTLFIIGYAWGPMFLSPLQEIPLLGRNTGYMVTFFLFVICQLPIIYSNHLPTILGFRFVTGFFGSPALATGGATLADIYPLHQLAYVIGLWTLGAAGGPILGPVVGGYAAQIKGWRWPLYEEIWLSAACFVFLFFSLPETYEPTILMRRAHRLRKLTGNPNLMSQGEKDAHGRSLGSIFKVALSRPFILAMEPVLLFCNIYLGFVYAIFYLWFEAFPLIFNDIYHFNLGASGLPFLAFVVSAPGTYAFYVMYTKYYITPRFMKAMTEGKEFPPEIRLQVGLMGSIFIPISLFMFGWTARESIHWIVPTIGAALYIPGIFLNLQSILIYVQVAYPEYAASGLAGNLLFRSMIASTFPIFGRAFFVNLGLGPGSSVLAGISLGLMVVFAALIKWGHLLRARSKYAWRGN